MYGDLGISKEVLEYGARIEAALEDRFTEIDGNAEYNQLKVIAAMQKNRVSDIHFSGTTGYGYNDLGRETLEQVYADVFHTEDALVRPQIVCGTHALYTALAGNLRPGDELLSPVGKPYDTLEEVIGIRESNGSLREYGILYRQVDLLPDGTFDYDGIRAAINEKTKLVTIQRSKGYASRPTLSAEQIGELIAFVKSIKPEVICMVDKPGRRTGADRRLYRRNQTVHRKCSLPPWFSGTRTGGRRESWRQPVLLPGTFPGTDRCIRRIKGSYLCGKRL